MTEPLTDRAAAFLSARRLVAIPLPVLARALATAPGALAAQLEEDDRFIFVQPQTYPDLTLLAPADRTAYEAAFRAAGWEPTPTISLAAPPPDGSVDGLLCDSVARLLARTPTPALAAAAERLQAALRTAVSPEPAAPSTTLPPRPSGRDGTPPRRRPAPRRPPPYPGSRRG